MVARPPRRGEVYLVNLDPTVGRKIRKTRPCVIVSPDELNEHLRTVLVAPITTGSHDYPFRLPVRFQRKAGHLVLDQLRAVDMARLVRRLGVLPPASTTAALAILRDCFAD